MSEFDFEGVFDQDYLYFYEAMLTPEVSDRQTEVIARLLDLQPGMRVLDVPCGHGRIAERLARLGCEVVGVDSSAAFLEAARQSAAQAGVQVDYRQGDMRALELDGEFDRVINIFTSFGYFDDQTDRSVLRSWRKSLRGPGKLLIDHQNRDRLLQMLLGPGGISHHVLEREEDLLVDSTTFDPNRGRTSTIRTIVRGGRVRRTRFSVRTFTFPELRDWLMDAGFASATAYDPAGEPFRLESRRMWVVAAT